MALMLRKACQPILNDADLDPYHADIDRQTKCMQLFTPCGKTFATVHGVNFSRLDVTKDDIEFACELLEIWLIRNKDKIEVYLDAFEILQRMEEPNHETTVDDVDYKVSTEQKWRLDPVINRHRNYIIPKGFTIRYKGVTFCLDEEGSLESLHTKDTTLAYPWASKVTLPKAIRAIGQGFLDEAVVYRQAKDTVDRILGELNTCDA
jgi:hypothetical protein